MQTIKPEIVEKLKENTRARYRLAYVFDIHPNNISKMLDKNDIKLTTPASMEAIAEELHMKKSELLTEK